MRNLLLLALTAGLAWGADFRAGAAKLDVTPEGPIWLSGYASRDHPSEGTLTRLYVRALALEDPEGNRAVILTADLIGFPGAMTEEVAARLIKKYDLDRPQILFNASHTHTGPVVWPNLKTMYDLEPGQVQRLKDYSRRVADALETVAGAALGKLEPATLAFGQGEVGFAANRRVLMPDGRVNFGVNPDGPVDHAVPVLRVTRPGGRPLAILFGYACHNTTLTGHHYRISGDYTGYAESALEAAHPGSVALFLALCGADQNPNPRGEVENAVSHGDALAREVRRVLGTRMAPVKPPLRSAFQVVDLSFRPHTRAQFEKDLKHENPAYVRRAREMLEAYEQRRPVRKIPYPVQGIRIGHGFTLLALGGEVVVDYSLRAKREYPGEPLVVAGYSNDVMCYIPSLRVLREGGYEPDRSMVYYGQPGPFTDEVEETIFQTIRQVMKRVGVEPGSP